MNYKAWMAFAALSVIWGFPYFLIKLAVTDVPPLMIAWCRVTMAALILVPIAWRRGALRSLGGHAGALLTFARRPRSRALRCWASYARPLR